MGDVNQSQGREEAEDDNHSSQNNEVVSQTSSEVTQALSENNPYTASPGALALYEQYGKDPRYKGFFAKLAVRPNGDITYNHMLFRNNNGNYTLTAKQLKRHILRRARR